MFRFLRGVAVALFLVATASRASAVEKDERYPLFTYLTGSPTPTMITYTPSQLDPRQETNQRKLATSSIRADLEALRPSFDGLILYGYNEASTPRIVAVAKDLKFRAILVAVWDVKSAAEIDGVAELVKLHHKDFALGVLLGNEGITFKRYEPEDLTIALARLRPKLPKDVPIATSEPLAAYDSEFVRDFGDFLAPNIHPVFHATQLGAKEAAVWTREQAAALGKKAKRPLLLKETGFPHDGKDPQAGKITYTPAAQKAFWTAYVEPGIVVQVGDSAKVWAFHGVAFEAFDLPWKAEESKIGIEKSWGLLSPKREAYPALAVWKALAEKK